MSCISITIHDRKNATDAWDRPRPACCGSQNLPSEWTLNSDQPLLQSMALCACICVLLNALCPAALNRPWELLSIGVLADLALYSPSTELTHSLLQNRPIRTCAAHHNPQTTPKPPLLNNPHTSPTPVRHAEVGALHLLRRNRRPLRQPHRQGNFHAG